MSFADVFTFVRPVAAPFTDQAGVTRQAAIDQPRFDYAARAPRGLLVEAGPAAGQSDKAVLIPRDWTISSTWTVLHDWEDSGGIRQDAHYATSPAAMINACLASVGHHRRIGAVPGYLSNYGSWVWALGSRWFLPGAVASDVGVVSTSAGALLLAS